MKLIAAAIAASLFVAASTETSMPSYDYFSETLPGQISTTLDEGFSRFAHQQGTSSFWRTLK